MKLVIQNKITVVNEASSEFKEICKNEFVIPDQRTAFRSGGFDAKQIEKVPFFNIKKDKIFFFTGMLYDILLVIKKYNITISIEDQRVKLPYQEKEYSYDEMRSYFNKDFKYVDHQIRALKKMLSQSKGIIKATTGGGKCFGKNTEILMYDGSIKKVQDVAVDDVIMGWDSTPRKVMSTTSGNDTLYKIKYLKGNGSHIVNSSHILTLKASRDLYKTTKKDDVIDISILDYLNQTKDFKRVWSLFQEPVLCWKEKNHKLDPYFLGVWLGDGRSNSPSITSIDEEVISYLYEYAENFNELSVKTYIQKDRINNYALTGVRKIKNEITEEFRALDLINNKHIPKEYLIDSYENRLKLLAGLLDTDGYLDVKKGVFEFSNKNKDLANEVVYLSKSLGFYSSITQVEKSSQNGTIGTYYTIYIAGDVYKIPTKIKRKQSKKREKIKVELKDPTKIGFEVEKLEEGEYFGFTLDGDGRFMLGDFIVSHNTDIILAFCKMVNLKVLILVNKQDLGIQTAKRLNNGGFPVIYRGSNKKGKIKEDASYVSTVGVAHELPNDFDVVIIDECHRASSKTFQDFLSKNKAKAVYGFSATPEGNHKVDFTKVKQHTGHIIEEIDAKEMLENEVIVFPEINFVEIVVPNTIDWPSANELCIVKNDDRNNLIRKLVEEHNTSTLILVKNIEHGKILNELIDGSIFVSGCKSSADRQEAIRMFDSGEIKTLIATNIFNEGISIDIIRLLIIASGGKSKIETTQKLGRGLRRDEGKEKVLVFDFYDLGNKFCHRHSESRITTYKKIGFPVNVLQD